MTIIMKRTFVVLAALMLAALTLASVIVGCDREVGEDEVMMGNPGGDELGEEGVVEVFDPGESEQVGEADEQITQVAGQVAEELDLPTSALYIGPQVSEYVADATSEVERRGWVMVSTVENYLTRLNVDNLEQEEREAAIELQHQIAEAERTLQGLQQAGEAEAELVESNLEDQLTQIGDNWDEIRDNIQVDEQPVGGGPLDDSQEMDDQP